MDSFFRKYPSLKKLQPLFMSKVSNQSWFIMSNEEISLILNNQEADILDFISNYNYEKGKLVSCMEVEEGNIEIIMPKETVCENVEMSETPSSNPQSRNHSPIPNDDFTNVPKPSSSNPTSNIEFERTDIFQYKQNDLYHFLNATFEGQIVLGVYKNTKDLDYARLKDLIILHLLKKDPLNFKIKNKDFIYYRDQIVELFPTEIGELFYIPYVSSKKNQPEKEESDQEGESGEEEEESDERVVCVGATGSLYNYYKTIRKELRLAGIFQPTKRRKTNRVSEQRNKQAVLAEIHCLTDPKRDNYKLADILNKWEETYKERIKLLLQKEKNVKTVPILNYFNSFPCLDISYSIILLESDFQNIIEDYKNKGLIPNSSNHTKTLENTWPTLSKNIITVASKSKIVEVKQFFKEHEELILAGKHNDLLAFFLIPISIKCTAKTKKVGDTVVHLTKGQISNSFILHVKDIKDLADQRTAHENWLTTFCLQDCPFIICCGELKEAQFFVILNKYSFKFNDLTSAVQTWYKCSLALRVEPSICDYVWQFLDRKVYNFTFKKANAFVCKFLVELNKLPA